MFNVHAGEISLYFSELACHHFIASTDQDRNEIHAYVRLRSLKSFYYLSNRNVPNSYLLPFKNFFISLAVPPACSARVV